MATAKKKTAQKKPAAKKLAETKSKAQLTPVKIEVSGSKKERLHTLLSRTEGSTIDEMMQATGWQKHSVRGFLSSLKKTGKSVFSEKENNERRYRIGEAPAKAEESSA